MKQKLTSCLTPCNFAYTCSDNGQGKFNSCATGASILAVKNEFQAQVYPVKQPPDRSMT